MPPNRRNDARKLTELLVENGRPHLLVRDEKGALVVCSLSPEGEEQKHFQLSPKGDGYEVAFWDQDKWRKAPIAGSLEKCVDELVSSGASRMAPPEKK